MRWLPSSCFLFQSIYLSLSLKGCHLISQQLMQASSTALCKIIFILLFTCCVFVQSYENHLQCCDIKQPKQSPYPPSPWYDNKDKMWSCILIHWACIIAINKNNLIPFCGRNKQLKLLIRNRGLLVTCMKKIIQLRHWISHHMTYARKITKVLIFFSEDRAAHRVIIFYNRCGIRLLLVRFLLLVLGSKLLD